MSEAHDLNLLQQNQAHEQVSVPTMDQSNELWRPAYGEYDRKLCMDRYAAIVGYAQTVADLPTGTIEKGWEFIESSFDTFEGKGEIEPASFAFAVPTRTSMHDGQGNGTFAQEIAPFMPLLNHAQIPAFHVSRWGTSLPPTVLERYQPNAAGESGVILYTPISPDIAELYDPTHPQAVFQVARKIVADAVSFAEDRLNVRAIGLGATLPALTNLGRALELKNPDTALTTGHAGTVHLIAETAKRLHEGHVDFNGTFGIIGAGAIGAASAQALLDHYPDAKFMITDVDPKKVSRLMSVLGSERSAAATDPFTVVQHANTIISAVTSDFELPEADYSGKAFIEDSMPTHVPQHVIEAGGGIVSWVIGEDRSSHGIITPTGLWQNGGYKYGNSFARKTDTFGCAGEAAVVSESRDSANALRRSVKPEDVKRIGQLFVKNNIVSSEPQRGGQLI